MVEPPLVAFADAYGQPDSPAGRPSSASRVRRGGADDHGLVEEAGVYRAVELGVPGPGFRQTQFGVAGG